MKRISDPLRSTMELAKPELVRDATRQTAPGARLRIAGNPDETAAGDADAAARGRRADHADPNGRLAANPDRHGVSRRRLGDRLPEHTDARIRIR